MSDSLIYNNLNVSSRIASQNQPTEAKNASAGKASTSNASTGTASSPYIVKDNADGVSVNKLFQGSEVSNLDPKTISTLKSYGVTINTDSLKLIAAIMKNMPGKVSVGDLLGLMVSRKISADQAGLVSKYANGTINFSALFANLSQEALIELKNSWSAGKVLEKLEGLVKLSTNTAQTKENSKLAEEIIDNMKLQELFSILPDAKEDGSIYFQWPIYWDGQDIPDCLEGEAFVPYDKDRKDSFSLRILINPPSLGQTEISLTTHGKELYVYFGVDATLKDTFKTIFPAIRDNILAQGDFTSVQFTVGTARQHNNFFSKENRVAAPARTTSMIDLKA